MNTAFQITQEDVYNVIDSSNYNESHTLCQEFIRMEKEEAAEYIFDRLDPEDFEMLEKSSLYGDDIGSQINYAYNELCRILIEKRILVLQ